MTRPLPDPKLSQDVASETFQDAGLGELVSAPVRGSNAERRAATIDLKDRRALRTKQALHAGLLSLLAERDFADIVIDDILERSQVSRSTYYRHHPTKEALLEFVGTSEIENLVDVALPLLEATDTYASCMALCRYVEKNRALWAALLTGGAAATMREIYARLIYSRLSPTPSSTPTMPRPEIPFDLGATWGVAGTFEILAWWLRQDQSVPIEIVAAYLDRLVVRPISD